MKESKSPRLSVSSSVMKSKMSLRARASLKGAGVNAVRTQTLLRRVDLVVVRFGERR